MKIESREGRKKLSIVPMGLNKEERMSPALKRRAIFNWDRNIYEMANSHSSLITRLLSHGSQENAG